MTSDLLTPDFVGPTFDLTTGLIGLVVLHVLQVQHVAGSHVFGALVFLAQGVRSFPFSAKFLLSLVWGQVLKSSCSHFFV